MFRSVYGSFDHDEKNDKNLSDGQGEPKSKASKHSEVGKREPNEGLEDVAASATLNKHHDGHFSVLTAEEGLSHHDDAESAAHHASKSIGGDAEHMGREIHGSMKSKLAPKGPKDDMSGSGM